MPSSFAFEQITRLLPAILPSFFSFASTLKRLVSLSSLAPPLLVLPIPLISHLYLLISAPSCLATEKHRSWPTVAITTAKPSPTAKAKPTPRQRQNSPKHPTIRKELRAYHPPNHRGSASAACLYPFKATVTQDWALAGSRICTLLENPPPIPPVTVDLPINMESQFHAFYQVAAHGIVESAAAKRQASASRSASAAPGTGGGAGGSGSGSSSTTTTFSEKSPSVAYTQRSSSTSKK